MTLEMGILLIELVSRGIDSGMKLKTAYDLIVKMTPAEVQQANESEEAKTVLLMNIAKAL